MNNMKILGILIVFATFAAFNGTVGAQQSSSGQGVKQDAKAVGHGIGNGARDIGHGAKKAGIAVGHGARDGWNATRHAVKHVFHKGD